jgi:anthranilate/para-aminobenzoate synthase component I
MVEVVLDYFFPGDCYQVVVEEYNFFDCKISPPYNKLMAYVCS